MSFACDHVMAARGFALHFVYVYVSMYLCVYVTSQEAKNWYSSSPSLPE